jgi:hypothetical protein
MGTPLVLLSRPVGNEGAGRSALPVDSASPFKKKKKKKADGVALLGLLLAPRPRMGGGSHRCSEGVREGFARSEGFLAVSAL